MDLNNVVAQQQALLNQFIQNAQHTQYGLLALGLAWIIIGGLVLYAFYARLRGIEQELMKFRIAYEFSYTPEPRTRGRLESNAPSSGPEPPKPQVPVAPSTPPEEKKYMPNG